MIRNLKVMGLALVALFAMSALFSSVASAQFEAGAEEVTTTASSNEVQKFQISSGGLTVECKNLEVKGSIKSATTKTTTATVHPTYSGCEPLLGQATSVTSTGCDYLFHLNEASTTGTTDVVCETGKAITIKIGSICTYTVGSQSGLNSVSFKNTGSGTTKEIIVEPNVGGISSTRTTNDLFCPAAGAAGTYKGNSTITGENAAGTEHIGVFVD